MKRLDYRLCSAQRAMLVSRPEKAGLPPSPIAPRPVAPSLASSLSAPSEHADVGRKLDVPFSLADVGDGVATSGWTLLPQLVYVMCDGKLTHARRVEWSSGSSSAVLVVLLPTADDVVDLMPVCPCLLYTSPSPRDP